MGKRITAIVEVLTAFVFVHVTYRAVKYFTAFGGWESNAGLNLAPGLAMIVFAVSALLVSRRDFEAYGLTANRWRQNLNIGLFWGITLVALAGLGLILTRVHFDPSHPHNDMRSRLAGALFGIVATALMVLTFKKRLVDAMHVSPVLSATVLVGLLSMPLVVAEFFNQSVQREMLGITWLFVGAGFGEETFFRGYIQSRVNEAFGRPYQIFGLNFGLGLCVSSLLFGFVHALNSVDYFHGRYGFAWWYGVQNCFLGLFYGCLREKTGGILAGGVTHGLTDVMARVPCVISGN